MGLNLLTNLPMFGTLFRPCDVTRLWKSTQFLLEFAVRILPLVHLLWSALPLFRDHITFHFHSFLLALFLCFFVLFQIVIPMRKCRGEHLCM